ncbi:MAG: DUF3530 domain-containing protein [Sedimenticola sp.]|nr:MAG: DUF3530 domain-containing protein [Sedimenticola sp.]
MWYRVTVGVLFCLLGYSVLAADLIREQRMAAEIEEAILVGEPVYLKDGDHEFLAIHAESELDQLYGGVIVVHGRGAHPDWTEVVNPMRSNLPGQGWETLSLQMPVAEADAPGSVYQALIPESFPRIAAGVAFFKERGIENIVIIAHSLGARMTAAYLGENATNPDVKAFVAVSLPVGDAEQGELALEALERIKIPVLDIYGSRDIDAVLTSVKQRAAAGRKAQNPQYSQVEITGADHFFVGLAPTLVSRVHAWLRRVSGS